jgi:hypothetical protein
MTSCRRSSQIVHRSGSGGESSHWLKNKLKIQSGGIISASCGRIHLYTQTIIHTFCCRIHWSETKLRRRGIGKAAKYTNTERDDALLCRVPFFFTTLGEVLHQKYNNNSSNAFFVGAAKGFTIEFDGLWLFLFVLAE